MEDGSVLFPLLAEEDVEAKGGDTERRSEAKADRPSKAQRRELKRRIYNKQRQQKEKAQSKEKEADGGVENNTQCNPKRDRVLLTTFRPRIVLDISFDSIHTDRVNTSYH